MKNTTIEWADHTMNPWLGCTKVSAGCAHCYAEGIDQRFHGGQHWGNGAPRQRTSAETWKQPLRWNKEAEKQEHRPRVFCASMADWLDPEVPIEWLADLLDLIRQTPNLDWLLLTKRPENWFERVGAASDYHFDHGDRNVCGWIEDWTKHGISPANVWIGTSVENQATADTRIPHLLQIPAQVRFLSCEPLLGAVDLAPFIGGRCGCPAANCYCGAAYPRGGIHWAICGAESGRNRRPMDIEWANSICKQCKDASVPFFMKQIEIKGKIVKDIKAFPDGLKVREFPNE